MIVVDTNVIAYLTLPGPRHESARAALRCDPLWVAPLLWRSEMRNVLICHVRAGHFDLDRAHRFMSFAEGVLRGREYTVASTEVLHLARRSGCSAYDCEFVTLALRLGLPLLTCDKKILTAFPRETTSLTDFALA